MSVRDITSSSWQPRLGAHGEIVEGIADIEQCIRTILLTPKGSVPHRPEFGSDLWLYLDLPVGEAVPHVVREGIEALRRWESRIEVVAMRPEEMVAHLHIDVEWRLGPEAQEIVTEVTRELA